MTQIVYAAQLDELIAELNEAVRDFDSASDELAEAIDASEADDVELAILTLESAASAICSLLDRADLLVESSLDYPAEIDRFSRDAVSENAAKCESAVASMKSIVDEMPSDGDQQDDQLENLVELADELYRSLADVFKR